MLPDSNDLWLGARYGLCRFNTRNGSTRSYYVEDGLTHNEFNRRSALRSRAGKLFFGGLNGVNASFSQLAGSTRLPVSSPTCA